MYDMIKRLAIAVTMMVFIGFFILGAKAIHAEENDEWLRPNDDGIITDTLRAKRGHHHSIEHRGSEWREKNEFINSSL